MSLRLTRLVASCATTLAMLTAAAPAGAASSPAQRVQLRVGEPTHQQPTTTRVASFNVLGHSHTRPGARPGWASGPERMGMVVKLLDQQRLSIVGLQEVQEPQFKAFQELTGATWGVYPARAIDWRAMANSIIWRNAEWELVSAQSMPVPYFSDRPVQMPFVLLRNRATGALVWFYNSHNPANTNGDAAAKRQQGFALERELVANLRAANPSIPVISTGDKNDRAPYVCSMVGVSELVPANGGARAADGTCIAPPAMMIDWVMGTSDVVFTGYRALRSTLVRRASDHPLIMADAYLPSQSVYQAQVKRVAVLNIPGLSSTMLARRGAELAPTLTALRAAGAQTLNARTAPEKVGAIGNLASLLTGRKVALKAGGHGVGLRADRGLNLHRTAGRYVSGIFDPAHDLGRATALISSRQTLARFDASWNVTNGAPDRIGLDNTRDKISSYRMVKSDQGAVDRVAAGLASMPLQVAHLSSMERALDAKGTRSDAYRKSLSRTDAVVARLINKIQADPTLATSTTVVITASRGSGAIDKPVGQRVPVIVWGAATTPGSDLYALNPSFANPGARYPGYLGAQPIRVGDLGNYVLSVLGIPAAPNSWHNSRQGLTAMQPPTAVTPVVTVPIPSPTPSPTPTATPTSTPTATAAPTSTKAR